MPSTEDAELSGPDKATRKTGASEARAAEELLDPALLQGDNSENQYVQAGQGEMSGGHRIARGNRRCVCTVAVLQICTMPVETNVGTTEWVRVQQGAAAIVQKIYPKIPKNQYQ